MSKVKSFMVEGGGYNTRFFQRLANSHRNSNDVRGLEVDGMYYEEESEV